MRTRAENIAEKVAWLMAACAVLVGLVVSWMGGGM